MGHGFLEQGILVLAVHKLGAAVQESLVTSAEEGGIKATYCLSHHYFGILYEGLLHRYKDDY